MKLNDFARRIPGYYKAGVSVCLLGPVGRGKSTVIERAATILSSTLKGNYGIVVLNGPNLTPTDLMGYLLPREFSGPDGKTKMGSVFTEPFFFYTQEGKHLSEYDGGIIFVDEEDKLDIECKKIIGEASLSGRVGPHRLAKGWVVWFAGNRAADRSASTKQLDHLINRRMEINIDDDIESLLEFMNAEGIHPLFKSFAASNPQVVFMPPPDKQGPWCTPRSLVQAAQYVQSLMDDPVEGTIPDDPLTKEEVRGKLGDAGSSQLWATIMLAKEMPKLADIVANPKKVPVPTRPDAQMLVCYTLAARVTEENIAPIMTYIERMPAEFTITFGKAAVAKDYNLINTPAFGDWTARNATLMIAVTDAR
jgi:energy-coupling factor transporter ATP-binding protein EcfA2